MENKTQILMNKNKSIYNENAEHFFIQSFRTEKNDNSPGC